MGKHTPGPWHAFMGTGKARATIQSAGGHVASCSMRNASFYKAPCDRPEMEANARLIAAAPDLLEALRAIVADHEFCGDDWGVRRDAWIVTARAAIAKAEGQQ